ncbi:Bulb-type lectin domain-containing protein [Psidium guajava]|nr:Bulb-type lectin domain-containing protein [Psidium guajava]
MLTRLNLLSLSRLQNDVGERKTSVLSTLGNPHSDTIEVGPGDMKMLFSSTSGQLVRMFNPKMGVSLVKVIDCCLAMRFSSKSLFTVLLPSHYAWMNPLKLSSSFTSSKFLGPELLYL